MAETLVTVHVISFSIPDAQNICPYFISHHVGSTSDVFNAGETWPGKCSFQLENWWK